MAARAPHPWSMVSLRPQLKLCITKMFFGVTLILKISSIFYNIFPSLFNVVIYIELIAGRTDTS